VGRRGPGTLAAVSLAVALVLSGCAEPTLDAQPSGSVRFADFRDRAHATVQVILGHVEGEPAPGLVEAVDAELAWLADHEPRPCYGQAFEEYRLFLDRFRETWLVPDTEMVLGSLRAGGANCGG
jgi:hypothetical protein